MFHLTVQQKSKRIRKGIFGQVSTKLLLHMVLLATPNPALHLLPIHVSCQLTMK